MRLRRIVGLGLTLAVAAGATATWALTSANAEPDDAAAVEWGACPEDANPEDGAGLETLECTTLEMPLDYGDPEGATTEVAFSRLASANPEKRRGILLLNPGGPGGSGLSQPADLRDLGIPSSVLESYDLVGMDPRGVGHSSPVSCGFTADQDYGGNIPPYAVDEADVEAQAEAAKAVAEQCAANDPEGLMRHMTTANTARDMDSLRAALGEEQLSFFGASYGSALGSAYASLFPEQSDRIIIDSNLGGTALDYDAQRRMALGVENVFPHFAAWAAERDASYGLGATPDEVRANFIETAERLDEQPVAEFDGALFRFHMFGSLYKERSYAPMAQLWQSLADSDAEAAREHAEELEPSEPGTPVADAAAEELSPWDNTWSAYLAVTCNDTDWPEDLASYQEHVAADREELPLFGAAGANVTPCAFWANDPVEPPVEIDAEGPANVLIMQNTLDSATPIEGGQLAREAFGDRSRLVTVEDNGHGVYVYNDNPCALNTATAFLVDGEFPESDVYCADSERSGLDLDEADQEQRADALERLGL